jgi:hypothetical protein
MSSWALKGIQESTNMYSSPLSGVSYEMGKVISQQTMREQLDYDPSEGQDWSWGNYE